MRPPQVWGAASAPPTGVRAASDDWLPGVGACNLIGCEAELGTCAGDEPSPYPPHPIKSPAVGVVRLNLNLKGLGSRLLSSPSAKKEKTDGTVVRAQG